MEERDGQVVNGHPRVEWKGLLDYKRQENHDAVAHRSAWPVRPSHETRDEVGRGILCSGIQGDRVGRVKGMYM